MRFKNGIVFLFVLFSSFIYAQDMRDFTGSWEGKIENKESFSLKVRIKNSTGLKWMFEVSNQHKIINYEFDFREDQHMKLSIKNQLVFEGVMSDDKLEINGFIKSGILLYHIVLRKEEEAYVGRWNILMIDELKLQNLFLSIENGSGETYEAYPFFEDNRFTGTWCGEFTKDKDKIVFRDFKTGLRFEGQLLPSKVLLSIHLGAHYITKIVLQKSKVDWKIGNFITEDVEEQVSDKNSNFEIVHTKLIAELEDRIVKNVFANTHSILVSQYGKVVYEKYFSGYNSMIPHDMRSASKSISSAVVGVTIDKGLLKNTNEKIYQFLPQKYQYTSDSLKALISIHSLLTMSSGLDAIDFGIKRKSAGSEDTYQQTKDWTKTILEVPMLYKPSYHANYGSANPHLLGVIANVVVQQPLALFIDQNLFKPLGITNYIIQTDISGDPYFGGGMYLEPRDMLKFGQLYLNGGVWKGVRMLSEGWVKASIKNYLSLENTKDKNGYGYLWWHHSYTVNGQEIKSIEARGAGGQYIFIIPALETVVVITSGNYRNNKGQQPETILENYILPTVLKLK